MIFEERNDIGSDAFGDELLDCTEFTYSLAFQNIKLFLHKF